MLDTVQDFDRVRERFRAFWACDMIDRPVVSIVLPKAGAEPLPPKRYASHQERWLDIDRRVDEFDHWVNSTVYFADALPVAYPNLGPEIYSAWCGCGYIFGKDTAWSQPCIDDWARDEPGARLNTQHPLYITMIEYTKKLIERGRGRFFTGLTDFHPGGDHIAALRDPQNLAIDMIEQPEAIKAALDASYPEYFATYDRFYAMIREGGSLACTWMGCLFGEGRFQVVSNDFSCMISSEMFKDVFLPGIAAECRFFDQAIYHLDGPGALHHLDALLDIPELNAMQWVCGAGNEGFARWAHVYKKIQAKGKAIELHCSIDELPAVFENLKPQGVWFSHIGGVNDLDTAQEVLRRIEAWR